MPTRLPVLWAKAIAVGITTVALCLPATPAAFFVGQQVLSSRSLETTLGEPGVLRAVVGSAVYLGGVGLLGLGFGTLLRSTASAISALLGVLFGLRREVAAPFRQISSPGAAATLAQLGGLAPPRGVRPGRNTVETLMAQNVPMTEPLRIRVGCDFRFQVPSPVPGVVQVEPTLDARQRVIEARLSTSPGQPRWSYQDGFGNTCSRMTMPQGPFGLTYDALVEVPGTIDDIDLDAPQMLVDQVPDSVLTYLMPSRFCVSDVMSDQAWEMFGSAPTGWRRVQTITEAVHDHLKFGYGRSSPTTTAEQAFNAAEGVCRDFAHVAITFCRAMNIPARYVFGYLPDYEVPETDAAMDFCAWYEVWLGGRWWTFDPRNNQHRKGRVVIGRGRDAIDVAMVTTYGAALLDQMTVIAEVEPA